MFLLILEINKFEIRNLDGINALTECLIKNDPDVLMNSLRALVLFKDCKYSRVEVSRCE